MVLGRKGVEPGVLAEPYETCLVLGKVSIHARVPIWEQENVANCAANLSASANVWPAHVEKQNAP